ncbi:MAG: hypothetical protein M0R03_15590 [Novosphingobium sp.]|nr:hypothetical protein [Novosphingobium sp.]
MKTIQELLQKDLDNGKSIGWFAKGFYITKGGIHGFDLKIPFFAFETEIDNLKPTDTTKVLVEYLGSMVWINVLVHWLYYGTVPVNYSMEAKNIRYTIENLKR